MNTLQWIFNSTVTWCEGAMGQLNECKVQEHSWCDIKSDHWKEGEQHKANSRGKKKSLLRHTKELALNTSNGAGKSNWDQQKGGMMMPGKDEVKVRRMKVIIRHGKYVKSMCGNESVATNPLFTFCFPMHCEFPTLCPSLCPPLCPPTSLTFSHLAFSIMPSLPYIFCSTTISLYSPADHLGPIPIQELALCCSPSSQWSDFVSPCHPVTPLHWVTVELKTFQSVSICHLCQWVRPFLPVPWLIYLNSRHLS